MAATPDGELKNTLQQQVAKLEKEAEESKQPAGLSAIEQLRRADGVFRDADHKRSQSVANVLRYRQMCEQAEHKEVETAKTLAQAVIARRAAAAAVGHAEGVGMPDNTKAGDVNGGPRIFKASWGTEFFNKLDDLECEPSERAGRDEIHQRLLATEKEMAAKEAEVRDWLTRMERYRTEIAGRVAKKRKVGTSEPSAPEAAAPDGSGANGPASAEGQASAPPPPAQPAAAAAAPAEAASSQKGDGAADATGATAAVEAEAKRLSEAKFQAEKQMKAGNGGKQARARAMRPLLLAKRQLD